MVVRLNGAGSVTLATDVEGPRSGPPVLLLHGGGQTRHAWRRARHALAEAGFRALAVDLRGHGDSDWAPDGDYSHEAYAEDLRAAARQLGRPVALIGASLGGIAAMLAVGESPRVECSALVLVDVTPRMSVAGRAQVLAFMGAHPDGFDSVEEAADAVAAYLPHRPRPRDPSGLRKNLRETADGRLRWHWDPRFVTGRGPRRDDVDDVSAERLEAAVRAADVPKLLVRGGASDLVSEEFAADFLALAPDAEYVNVPGAAHMVAGDDNDAFAASVVDFLRRHVVTS
jgi:pimeloyl-ACP methyl ester carboxylesterase